MRICLGQRGENLPGLCVIFQSISSYNCAHGTWRGGLIVTPTIFVTSSAIAWTSGIGSDFHIANVRTLDCRQSLERLVRSTLIIVMLFRRYCDIAQVSRRAESVTDMNVRYFLLSFAYTAKHMPSCPHVHVILNGFCCAVSMDVVKQDYGRN